MSTRSNILIVTPDNKVQQFYHHWDGYLSGVGEELRNMVNRSKLVEDISFYEALLFELDCDNSYEKEELMSLSEDNELHGDIEFLYIIKDNNLYYINSYDLCHKYKTNNDLIKDICNESHKIDLENDLTDED